MKAPDRMFMYGRSCSAKRSDLPAGSNPIEYLRKGAFPVEELKEALDDRYGSETAVAFRAEYKLMERILSLLEGANGGMGDE